MARGNKTKHGIWFDPDRHVYHLDGQAMETVTEITSQFLPVQFFTQEARDRGNAVHSDIEDINIALISKKRSDIVWAGLVHDGYTRAYMDFIEATNFRPTHAEHVVYCRGYGYAGTLDVTGKLKGTGVLIDVKTGGNQPSYQLQTAALAIAFAERRDQFAIKRRFALQLNPNGTYRLQEHKERSDMSVFLAALQTYRWRIQNKLLTGGYTENEQP